MSWRSFTVGVDTWRAFSVGVDPPRFEDDSEEALVKIREQEGPPDPFRIIQEAYDRLMTLPVLFEPEELAWRQTKNKRRNRARFRARELRRLSGSPEPAPTVLPAPAPAQSAVSVQAEPGPEADLIAAMRKIARGKIIPMDYMEMILPPDWTPEERAFLEEMTRAIAFNRSDGGNPDPEPDILAATRDIARGS